MIKIREYGRMELAQIYSPDIQPESAWRKLRKWITLNRQLSERLQSLGYDGSSRSFTPAQVKEIVEYIGDP